MCCFAGVAVGSGWQAVVAFVNLGSYYLVGVPLGVFFGWFLAFGITVYVCYIVTNTSAIRILIW